MKLNLIQQKEALSNFLKVFDKNQKYFIEIADRRIGKKFAISENTENGGINTKSNFMTYDEMNCFFMGMLTITENRIKF